MTDDAEVHLDRVRALARGSRDAGRLDEITDLAWQLVFRESSAAADAPERLWRLARVAPPLWSARVLRELGRTGWVPDDPAARRDCTRLISLAAGCRPVPTTVLEKPDLPPRQHRPDYQVGTRHLAVSPDGRRLAAAGYGVRSWRLPSGEPEGVRDRTELVQSVAVSPDGRYVVSKGFARSFRVWSAAGGELVANIRDPGNMTALTVAAGGLLAAGGNDRYDVHLWRLPGGEPAGVLEGHTGWVRALAATPQGDLLATASLDHTVRLWRLADRQPVGVIDHGSPVWAIAISPDGRVLAGVDNERVRFWRLPSGEPAGQLAEGTAGLTPAFTPDGRYLIVAGGPPGVRLWHVASGRSGGALVAGTFVPTLAVLPQGPHLVTAGDDDAVRVRPLWASLLEHPVGAFVPDDVDRLPPGDDTPEGERAWVELVRELARQRHRHEVEIVADDDRAGPGTRDVDLGP